MIATDNLQIMGVNTCQDLETVDEIMKTRM